MSRHSNPVASARLKKSAMTAQPGQLDIQPPPTGLAPFVSGFVHRDERVDGRAVRLLPDVRTSVQIMLADPYWIRERGDGEAWQRLPRIALWGPRHDWGYGYAAAHVTCFAFGLTPAGFRAVTGGPARRWLNRVEGLDALAPALAAAIDPREGEPFMEWMARIIPALEVVFAGAAPVSLDWPGVTRILAEEAGGAVRKAADAAGLSERQFRRVFEALSGVAPKRYQRALRVDRIIRQLHPAPWEADTAPDIPIPFADQPHAIREFRALTGLTPADYVRLKTGADRTLRSVGVDGLALPQG